MHESPVIVTGILVGGKSKRMGTDKALLPCGDVTLIERVARVAQAVSTECVLLGRMTNVPESLRDWPQLPDAHANTGPIAGLASLLRAFPDRWCCLLSCDLPRIEEMTIRQLVGHASDEFRVVAYADQNPALIHATAALYHAALLPQIDRAIADNRRSMKELIESVPHALVQIDDATRQALLNLNTPEDLCEL